MLEFKGHVDTGGVTWFSKRRATRVRLIMRQEGNQGKKTRNESERRRKRWERQTAATPKYARYHG